jgi:hypothetical protein
MRIARAEAWLAALAVAAALAPAIGAATELGTLFNTPEERARLDRLRRGEPEVAARGATPGAREITGFVKRSDGRATVWIDGIPLQVASPKAGALLEPNMVRGHAEPRELHIERSKDR